MSEICEADINAVLGEMDALILHELLRAKASISEFESALEWVRHASAGDYSACRSVPARVHRLVDLLSVCLSADNERRPVKIEPGDDRRGRAA